MQSLWQAALGRPGRRTERRRRSEESCSRAGERQKPALEQGKQAAGPGGGVGAPEGGAGLLGKSRVGACSLRVCILLGAGQLLELGVGPRVLKVMGWEEEEKEN